MIHLEERNQKIIDAVLYKKTYRLDIISTVPHDIAISKEEIWAELNSI